MERKTSEKGKWMSGCGFTAGDGDEVKVGEERAQDYIYI